jgi:hypothetical protein
LFHGGNGMILKIQVQAIQRIGSGSHNVIIPPINYYRLDYNIMQPIILTPN